MEIYGEDKYIFIHQFNARKFMLQVRFASLRNTGDLASYKTELIPFQN